MNPKTARRLRRQTNQARRFAMRQTQDRMKDYAVLLAILAQKGGEITITQGTIDQIGEHFKSLSYVVATNGTKGEFVVRLVEGPSLDEPQTSGTAAEPAYVIRKVEDETDGTDDSTDTTPSELG